MIYMSFRSFSTDPPKSNNSSDAQNENMRSMEYEAPIDDTKNPEMHRKFLQMVFIFIPFTLYLIYKTFFVRVNSFSKCKEIKIISDNFERKVVGRRTTNRIMKEMQGKIYKEDSEEAKRIKRVIDTLIEK